MKVILEILDQYDTNIDLIKYVWVSDFHGPVISALHLQEYMMDECHMWDNGSMRQKD